MAKEFCRLFFKDAPKVAFDMPPDVGVRFHTQSGMYILIMFREDDMGNIRHDRRAQAHGAGLHCCE